MGEMPLKPRLSKPAAFPLILLQIKYDLLCNIRSDTWGSDKFIGEVESDGKLL